MNRTLQRPMFRIGGSAGTGITSGLDQPRKQYAQGSGYMDEKIKEIQIAFKRYQDMGGTLPFEEFAKEFATENFNTGGRVGYQQGTMPNFQMSGLPGFLTGVGLNLLATPPQGNIFQTLGTAARDPFNQLQISQARARELEGEREFLRGETDRKLEAADRRLDKELDFKREELNMQGDENVMSFAEIFKDSTTGSPNMIKGQNAVDFFKTEYNNLTQTYGKESVAVEPIDASTLKTQKALKLFRKQNPGAEGKVFFDVASGQAVKLAKDTETGDLALIPATGVTDTEGDAMPAPNTTTPGLFGQETKPDVVTPAVKEFLEDKNRPEFGMGFYDQ